MDRFRSRVERADCKAPLETRLKVRKTTTHLSIIRRNARHARLRKDTHPLERRVDGRHPRSKISTILRRRNFRMIKSLAERKLLNSRDIVFDSFISRSLRTHEGLLIFINRTRVPAHRDFPLPLPTGKRIPEITRRRSKVKFLKVTIVEDAWHRLDYAVSAVPLYIGVFISKIIRPFRIYII